MSLFECSKCGCIENSALGDFWVPRMEGRPVLCSECSTGTWHGRFTKKSAVGMCIDQSGGLWSPEGVKVKGHLPPHFKIVGTVQPRVSIEPGNRTGEGK